MRDDRHEASDGANARMMSGAAFLAASDHPPPTPGQIAGRLGALLAIALGFGVVAQFLVRVAV